MGMGRKERHLDRPCQEEIKALYITKRTPGELTPGDFLCLNLWCGGTSTTSCPFIKHQVVFFLPSGGRGEKISTFACGMLDK